MKAVITGRRASQGAARAGLKPLEVDETGLIKLNPLFAWTFPFVEWYIKANNVPTNNLLSQGYRSIGDWHSTVKSGEGDAGERGGRWAENDGKTECGLHADYFSMKAAAKKVRGDPEQFLALSGKAYRWIISSSVKRNVCKTGRKNPSPFRRDRVLSEFEPQDSSIAPTGNSYLDGFEPNALGP